MVVLSLSKMYCSEQIVIPEKISNLLKTYAKAALKTQPYDLLRWSAAYFRCLSLDVLPPVKPRYEHENVFGCLTKGYLKVLLSQVGKGFFIRRDVLEHRWSGLCLPEDELLKFLSVTRMLYWPQVHWLKLLAVMVGSINQSFKETVNMLCELLTDEPEGGSSPIPLWIFRECFKYLAELDCSAEQTFFDGRKVLSDGILENEMRMPNIPKKLSAVSFKNAIIDYWKFNGEGVEKTPESSKVDPDNVKDESNAATNFPNLQIVSRTSSASLRDGIEFRIVGDLKNPREIINRTSDFESVIVVLQQLKCDVDSECRPDTHVHESQQVKTEVENISDEISEFVCDNEAQNHLSEKYRKMLKKLGPPWNWLYEFATMNCSEMSYNYIESLSFEVMKRSDESNDDIDEAKVGEIPSSTSEMSGISYSDCTLFECNEQISKNHKVLIDAICSISEASDNGDCNIRDTNSIGSFLDEQMSKQQLQPSDYERLRKFISKAEEQGLVFNDLNELYNFFIQESSRENINYEVEIREEDEEEGEVENVIATTDATQVENKKVEREIKDENKHVTTIFNESGIELDGKTLDTKLSEQMILGLVDKLQFEENISDVASAISSSSQAETIRMNQNNQEGAQLWPQNGKKEENMQTSSTSSMSYLDSLTHQKKIQSKQVGKSKSASSIKRQPFVCKIPSLPGIGPSMNKERVEKILRFIFHRSFKQGGLVYPRNFSEDNCPNMMTE